MTNHAPAYASYPALIIDKAKLTENIATIRGICKEKKVSFCAVTKSFCAVKDIVDVYYEADVKDFADTRIANLKRISHPGITRWLLRLPMLSEVDDVVKYSDISLNSEISTVAALSASAVTQNRVHKIILMIDGGDLREGVLPQDAAAVAEEMMRFRNIEFLGVGTNYNCFGGVIPSGESLQRIIDVADEISVRFRTPIQILSGGNSGSFALMTLGTLPRGVNHLRLGEVILFGRETSYQWEIPGMHQDIFRLDVQIIELKKKPSVPMGRIGLNAFGEKVVFPDKGEMLRAIVACGRQDVDISKITPIDPHIELLGQSSDHMIVDLTRAETRYRVGDVLSFDVSYGSLLSLCTSEYVAKVLV